MTTDVASLTYSKTREGEPCAIPLLRAEGIANPKGQLIRFITLGDNQSIDSILFVNNLRKSTHGITDRYHFALTKYQKSAETGSLEKIGEIKISEAIFHYGLLWFERKMQNLTGTVDNVRNIEDGSKWQLRQIQRFQQGPIVIPTAEIVQMTEISAVLAGMKTQLFR